MDTAHLQKAKMCSQKNFSLGFIIVISEISASIFLLSIFIKILLKDEGIRQDMVENCVIMVNQQK